MKCKNRSIRFDSLTFRRNAAIASENPAEPEIRRLNAEEVEAFLTNDPKVMALIWSDDLVITSPQNKFLNKPQVLEMVAVGLVIINFFDRQIESIRFYGETAIVAGSETLVRGGNNPNAGKAEHLRFSSVWMI